MASINKYMLCLVMAVVVLAVGPKSEAAVSCATVVNYLTPCVPYLSGKYPSPLGGCCGGIKRVYALGMTKADRQSICNCLKSLAQNYPSFIRKAAGLPGQCGVKVPYNIGPSTNCNKVT